MKMRYVTVNKLRATHRPLVKKVNLKLFPLILFFSFWGCKSKINPADFHPEKASALSVIIRHDDDKEKIYSFEKESHEYIFTHDWILKHASGWRVNMGTFTDDELKNERLHFIILTREKNENDYVVVNYLNTELERKQFIKEISRPEMNYLLTNFEK
jgi:hypothetical protein